MPRHPDIPSYESLLARTDAPPGSSWGLFGADDEIGTLNFLTSEHRVRAAGLVRHGWTYSLDLPLDAFPLPLIPHRGALQHSVFGLNEFHRDDRIDNLFPQATSQIDGLRHFGHPDYGFYNHADPQQLVAGNPTLGIQRFAEHGIVGRGVLLDVERYLEHRGTPIDHANPRPIPPQVLEETAVHQGVSIEPGDILLIRFGWLSHHFARLRGASDAQDNSTSSEAPTTPLISAGLEASHETAAWLWNQQISVAAADNVALEAWPATGSTLTVKAELEGKLPTSSHTGMLHRILIPLLGLVIGELWQLDGLADTCLAEGRYDFMVVATPLKLPGGVGSPANAVAIL